MRSGPLLAVITGGLLAGLVTGSAAQEAANIQGAWVVVSAERNAKPAEDVTGHRLTFSGDTFNIQREGRVLYRGTYSVETGRKPAQIDFLHTEGAIKGKTWKGIYRFEGADLRICDNAPEMARPRPTRFSARAGSGYICILFKRATG
jgi:uncharacterized protein (TIGR03067 family)